MTARLASHGAVWPAPACANVVRGVMEAARAFAVSGEWQPLADGASFAAGAAGAAVSAAGAAGGGRGGGLAVGFRRPANRQVQNSLHRIPENLRLPPKIMVSKGDDKYQSTRPPW